MSEVFKKSKDELLVCRVTRKNMQFSFLWPRFGEQLNPSKWYYIKISVFLMIYWMIPLSVLMHVLVAFNTNSNVRLSEDFAVLGSVSGMTYMMFLYVRQQPAIASLLKDLSVFEKFGKPPGFDALNKKLSIWSWLTFSYTTFGVTNYNISKLVEKPQCEEENIEKNLHEHCGFQYPFWIPFKSDHFPIFHTIIIYNWVFSVMFFRAHLSVFFQIQEIAQHILLRIKHLENKFEDTFNTKDYVSMRQKLNHCINYHQEILKMSSKLNSCFSGLMLLHFLVTAAICGCLEKQFVDGISRGSSVGPLLGWVLSLFIASHGGQILLTAGDSLSTKIFATNWYEAPTEIQKDLMFVIMKAQKNLRFTVGPLGNVSYAFFLSVMKMSYSILTMLES